MIRADKKEDDGINGIKAQEGTEGLIYDLTGRRVEKVQKGIFIKDGKKVAVK